MPMMKLLKWAGGLLAAAALTAAVVLTMCGNSSDRHQKSHEAISRASDLVLGCQAYSNHPKSGAKYPAALTDLIHSPFGGGPFALGSEDSCKDPWGNPYKYALVRNEKGEWEPYVWAQRTVNGKTTLLGAMRTVEGQTKLFGMPD